MMTIGRSPAQPALHPQLSAAATKANGEDRAGSGFADLLGGLVARCTGTSGFLEEADTTLSADSDASQHASVFNSHGLFHGLTTEGPSDFAEASPSAAAPTPLPPAEAVGPAATAPREAPVWSNSPAESPVALLIGSTRQQTGSGLAEAGIAVKSPTPVRSFAVSVRASAAPASNAVAFEKPAANGGVERAPIASGVRAARSVWPARTRETAGNGVAVSLQAVDRGQAVVAHVGIPDPAQRVKLRDRIVALLSRYGLIPRSVRIDGHIDPSESAEKER